MDVFDGLSERDQANGLKFEFRKSGEVITKPRGYRELVADAQLALDLASAREARERFERSWSVDSRDWPPERPRRDAAGAEARRVQLEPTWGRLRAAIVGELTDFIAYTWVEPCALADFAADTLFVEAPSYIRGWVRERYGALFRHAARQLAGRELDVVFVAPYADSPCVLPEGVAA